MEVQHRPVQLTESLDLLAVERGGVYVDATVGLGGHAAALLARNPNARLVGIDQDPDALERAGRRLAEFGDRVRLVQGNFFDLAELLAGLGIQAVAGVLADLGVSSLQLETAERGFSFRREGPLDMRMGRMGQTDGGGDLTAADVVNGYSEGDLERIFRDYGEERQARRLARAIAAARSRAPLKTTGELKALIDRVKGHPPRGYREGREGREGRVDPATRVFQALRIEVNRELEGLERFLDQAVRLLEADGRLVVISYHSLEDRIVKNTLRDLARGQVDPVTGRPQAESRLIEMLTRKPVRPTDAEVDLNPRSRSARLRAARRLAPP